MKKWLGNLLGALALVSTPVFSQNIPAGLFQGYDGEWNHVSKQLIDLAEATPAEKFSWRPAPGVRSTSEVYMHIAISNFVLLSFAAPTEIYNLKIDDVRTLLPESYLRHPLTA